MNLSDAQSSYDSTQHWVATRMASAGLHYQPPSAYRREIELFDLLAGDATRPSERYKTAASKLKFYGDRFKSLRGVSLELDGFMAARYKEALHGR